MIKTETLILQMGPQHPSTHGVLRLELKLDGEKVIEAVPHIGYLHRGIEKLAESKSYSQVIPLTDRLDYLASPSMNLGYVLAVEKILGITPSERADYIRIIINEFSRLASHLLWLGTHALDIGAMTVFIYTFRERETIMDLFEMYCGMRMTVSCFNVGGVRWDLPEGFIEKANEFLNDFPTKISEYEQLLTNNPIWLERTKGVGVITAEEAINYGLTGPSLRGSGVKWDLRKAQPYSIYDRFDFEIPIGKAGDTYDRYLVRLEEMRQSTRIIKQALEKIPKEPIAEPTADGQPVQVPKKKPSAFGVGKKFKVPPGEAYIGTEAPKGELGFYVISDGSTNPYRVKIRAPSFVNLQTLNMMVKGRLYADVVAVIGTLDIVLGEIDR